MTDALSRDSARRSKRALENVKRAISAMERNRVKISLRAVSAEAGVSRNYIYTTPEALKRVKAAIARSELKRVRRLPKVVPQRGGSDESLRMRMAAALVQIDELKREVVQLKESNAELVTEVINLQNPLPNNVAPMRRRRS